MRRSARVQSNQQKAQKEKEFLDKVMQNCKYGLAVTQNDKGRGILTTKEFFEGDYVATYEGQLITHKEAMRRYKSDSGIIRPFWAAAPKGRCPVGHRREFPDRI